MRRRLTAAAVLLCLLGCLSGCAVRGDRVQVAYLPLNAPVSQLDPQMAREPDTVSVLGVLFEGLVRLQPDGSVAPGAAQWEVSGDGTVYTFHLYPSYWCVQGKTDRAVTAADFAYGMRRALDEHTDEALAERLYDIAGARAFRQGLTEGFGVQAPDEQTLQITLTAPNEAFLPKLAESVFFPCREDIFTQAAGRYGMTSGTLATNGPFSLTAWSDTQLKLTRNEGFHDREAYALDEVRFVTVSGDMQQAIEEQTLDAAPVTDEQAQALTAQGVTVLEQADQVLGLYFDHDHAVLAQVQARQALLAGMTSLLPGGQPAAGFVPPASLLPGGERYVSAVQWGQTDAADARPLWQAGLKAAGLASAERMTLLCTEDLRPMAEQILQAWQKYLSLYFAIETVPTQAQMEARLRDGRFQIALSRSVPADEQAGQQLACYAARKDNPCHYANAAFAAAAEQPGDRALLTQLEQTLADQCVWVPIAFPARYTALSGRLKGLTVRPFNGGAFCGVYDLRGASVLR